VKILVRNVVLLTLTAVLVGIAYYYLLDEPQTHLKIVADNSKEQSTPLVRENEAPIPQKTAESDEHFHPANKDNPPTKHTVSERDELGISSLAGGALDQQGYPNVTTRTFSLRDSSNLLKQGELISVTFFDGVVLSGEVLGVAQHASITNLTMRLLGLRGIPINLALSYGSDGKLEHGFILAPIDKYSYKITPISDSSSEVLIQAVERESILPEEIYLDTDSFPATKVAPLVEAGSGDLPPAEGSPPSAPESAPPILQSRPGAPGVIFLDFDGHVTTGNFWSQFYNNNTAIISEAVKIRVNYADGTEDPVATALATSNWIREVWQRVSECFSPFTINVTTSADVFRNAGSNQKIRVVISPTSSWYPNVGGVAFVGSWSWSKGDPALEIDAPTYVFPNMLGNNTKTTADATTHEVGHTLGLSHDGRTSPSEAYYWGQGAWAPNMGAGYNKSIVQWSKGEYASANNPEDDIAIMDTYAGVDIIADSVGNTTTTATALSFTAQQAQARSLIERADDLDMFSFSTVTGNVTINAASQGVNSNGALNLRTRLYGSNGNLLQTAAPASSGNVANLNANIGVVTLNAGTYYIAVDGPGEGAANATGFSSYGSIGSYVLSVIIPAGSENPTATSTATPTNTLVPPTATQSFTPIPPTATSTSTRTATPIPPTATSTNTAVPPTATSTATRTNTPIPPTPTYTPTPVPPTATPTPTLNSTHTPTATASVTSTHTAIPSLTSTPEATNTPEATKTPMLTPTATPTSDECSGTDCGGSNAPIASSKTVSLSRQGDAIFSLDATVNDPDLITDFRIAQQPELGLVAPLINDETDSRSGKNRFWSYSVYNYETKNLTPLEFDANSRIFTRQSSTSADSNNVVIKRKSITIAAAEALVMEYVADKPGKLIVIPTSYFTADYKNALRKNKIFIYSVYLNGELFKKPTKINLRNLRDTTYGLASLNVNKSDVVRVSIESVQRGAKGGTFELPIRLFWSLTTGYWTYTYDSKNKKTEADSLVYYALSDQNIPSNKATINFVPQDQTAPPKRRVTSTSILFRRVLNLVTRAVTG
jgi:hypothetical protein